MVILQALPQVRSSMRPDTDPGERPMKVLVAAAQFDRALDITRQTFAAQRLFALRKILWALFAHSDCDFRARGVGIGLLDRTPLVATRGSAGTRGVFCCRFHSVTNTSERSIEYLGGHGEAVRRDSHSELRCEDSPRQRPRSIRG